MAEAAAATAAAVPAPPGANAARSRGQVPGGVSRRPNRAARAGTAGPPPAKKQKVEKAAAHITTEEFQQHVRAKLESLMAAGRELSQVTTKTAAKQKSNRIISLGRNFLDKANQL